MVDTIKNPINLDFCDYCGAGGNCGAFKCLRCGSTMLVGGLTHEAQAKRADRWTKKICDEVKAAQIAEGIQI